MSGSASKPKRYPISFYFIIFIYLCLVVQFHFSEGEQADPDSSEFFSEESKVFFCIHRIPVALSIKVK